MQVMRKSILIAALLASSISAANWAVLVAGSNGYWNYRHQADVCHSYHSLVKGGIPASNIIVFAYDDIAHSLQNPFRGKLFNNPNGPDYYAGCQIDYKKKDVTSKNFLSVLKQDSAAMKNVGTGRVLKSTKDDKVFIYFSDHGAPGLIAFPSEYLYEQDLTPVLTSMWTNKQYAEAVFYLETCDSGSMFIDFPTDQKLYALTAANAAESSWATYCPPDDDLVNGKHIGTCLGDAFSVNWMEDIDSSDTRTESLNDQFTKVHTLTTQSNVLQLGDKSFKDEALVNFVGSQKKAALLGKANHHHKRHRSSVHSRDIKLHYLINRHARELTTETQEELNLEIRSRRLYDDLFLELGELIQNSSNSIRTRIECYRDMIESLEDSCGKTSDYGLKYFSHLFDLCACDSCDHKQAKVLFTKHCLNAIPSISTS